MRELRRERDAEEDAANQSIEAIMNLRWVHRPLTCDVQQMRSDPQNLNALAEV